MEAIVTLRKVRGAYQPFKRLFVVEFLDPVFVTLSPKAVSDQKWTMFTHGVCCPYYDRAFHSMHKIALTSWHVEANKEGLNERLDAAIWKLNYMTDSAAERAASDSSAVVLPHSPFVDQCRVAALLLVSEREHLVEELLTSWQQTIDLSTENTGAKIQESST